MNLFKKTKPACVCACDPKEQSNRMKEQETYKISVLGSGCKKCRTLEENAALAVQELGMKENVQHVHDIAAIASYGVMSTPALVIDGKVVSEGRILSPDEIQTLLKKEKEENETGHGE